jgi:hypothetical protein
MTRPGDVLTHRALNRAMLARQLLLDRRGESALATIEHLVGLQAQAPNAPYVALWSRLGGFTVTELSDLVMSRAVVRIGCLRGTIHLVTAQDARVLRPLTQIVLTRAFNSNAFARHLAGLDLDDVLAAARDLLAEKPRTRAEIARFLAGQWPGYDPTSLGYAASYLIPLIQVPPRGVWGNTGPICWTLAESWLGRELDEDPSVDEVMIRYLAAFGPATVADVQTWSGLTKLREVADRLRPRLRAFRAQAGTELLDLPDAPRPDPDTPAPPRFLPEYDNVSFSYADRARVNPGGYPLPLSPGNGGRMGTLLVDGTLQGTWRITAQRDQAILRLTPCAKLSPADRAAITAEGAALLEFATAEATSYDIQWLPPPS